MLSGLNDPECRMNAGKTLFSQVMEFVPWKSFGRIIDRRRGDAGVRTLGCSDLFRIMAFAQLTWRESLRDIEACMAANQAKLFHMGLKSPPARLAHLSRPGPAADRPRTNAVCSGIFAAGMAPRRSSRVCSLMAALLERNGAQSNRLRQRSMVVESSA